MAVRAGEAEELSFRVYYAKGLVARFDTPYIRYLDIGYRY